MRGFAAAGRLNFGESTGNAGFSASVAFFRLLPLHVSGPLNVGSLAATATSGFDPSSSGLELP